MSARFFLFYFSIDLAHGRFHRATHSTTQYVRCTEFHIGFPSTSDDNNTHVAPTGRLNTRARVPTPHARPSVRQTVSFEILRVCVYVSLRRRRDRPRETRSGRAGNPTIYFSTHIVFASILVSRVNYRRTSPSARTHAPPVHAPHTIQLGHDCAPRAYNAHFSFRIIIIV